MYLYSKQISNKQLNSYIMKALKTNSKEVAYQINTHILECVADENENNFTDIVLAAREMYCEFDRVANYPTNMRNMPNEQARFQDYLAGLPFSFLISTWDKEQFLNSLGINPEGKQYDSDKIEHLYSYLIYKQMIKHGK